jgi:hypothetical protein
MRAVLVVALLSACQRDARTEDCATVRQVLDRHDPRPHGAPRRYYDYTAPASAEIFEADVTRDLQHQHYTDPDVAAAVRAVADTGWTIYTPYSTDHTTALDRLRELCHIAAPRVTLGI